MPVPTREKIRIDYSAYLSLESKHRVRSRLKEIQPFSEIPGMINVRLDMSFNVFLMDDKADVQFGVGVPHPSTFPVDGMTLSLPFTDTSVFVPGFRNREPSCLPPLAPYKPPSKLEALNPDLGEESQYSYAYGQKHLLKWLKEHVERVHQPKYTEWRICSTAGNTDGVDGVLRALLDRGDHLLVEELDQLSTSLSCYRIALSPDILVALAP